MRSRARRTQLGRIITFLSLAGHLLGVPCQAAAPAWGGAGAGGDASSSSIAAPADGPPRLIIADSSLQVDTVAADAAAQGAVQFPSKYAAKGIIDPQSPLFSEDPGLLVPLAQAFSSVSHWLEAVDAAGPGSPLSDPMFVGTVLIPNDRAFEKAYPLMRTLKARGQPMADAFANVTRAALAAQLNSLTVPGALLRVAQLVPGSVLRTADGGVLQVVDQRVGDKPARLRHLPSAVSFTLLEPDLQSGNAVAHIVDALLPPAALSAAVAQQQQGAAAAAAAASAAGTGPARQGRHGSALGVLAEPAHQLGRFAALVQQAGLSSMLASPGSTLTLFAPSDKAVGAFMAQLPRAGAEQLSGSAGLMDQLVSGHLVMGVALGSKALEALLPPGELRTLQGNVVVQLATERAVSTQQPLGPAGAVVVAEAGQPQPSLRRPLLVGDARIVEADLLGGKAVVHVVDRVLLAPGLAQQLGMPASASYTALRPPQPTRNSGAAAAALPRALCLAAAAAAMAVWGL